MLSKVTVHSIFPLIKICWGDQEGEEEKEKEERERPKENPRAEQRILAPGDGSIQSSGMTALGSTAVSD